MSILYRLSDEVVFFERAYREELAAASSDSERRDLEADFKGAMARLKEANARHKTALFFAIAIVLVALLGGLEDAMAAAVMLLAAPSILSRTLRKSQSDGHYLRSKMEDKTNARDLFANAVWCNAVCAAAAGGMYYWGRLEPGGGYWF